MVENFVLIGVFVCLGLLFRRIAAFPRDSAQAFNMFALHVSLPAVVLLKVPQIAFSSDMLVAAVTPWGMLLLSAALVLAVGRFLKWERDTIGVLLLVVPIGNTSFLGVPMVQAFFGSAGIPFLLVYDQFGTMVIFATYGSLMLALYGHERAINIPALARRVLLFPPAIAMVLGLSLRSWPYPEKVVQVLQVVGSSLTPLVMTAIGFQMRLRLAPCLLAPLGFGLGVKLLLAPLATLALFRLAGIQGLAAEVTVFEAGMAPMVTAAALAAAAGMNPELAIAMAGLGIVASFATLPVLYWLMQL